MGTYLVYHIDEGLGIFPTEMFNSLGLILLREYVRDQRDTFLRFESVGDQSFPGGRFPIHKRTVRFRECMVCNKEGAHTSRKTLNTSEVSGRKLGS